jgi:hypothetical protein
LENIDTNAEKALINIRGRVVMAITFAEAGEDRTAREILNKGNGSEKEKTKTSMWWERQGQGCHPDIRRGLFPRRDRISNRAAG